VCESMSEGVCESECISEGVCVSMSEGVCVSV